MTSTPSDPAEETPALRSSAPSVIPDAVVALLLAGCAVLLLLSLRPLTDLPMNDDFSWARSALSFARTGRIVYNGWGNPMLLPHIIIGGLIIKVCGFSHRALSVFGMLTGGAFAASSYLLFRASRLSRPISLFFAALLVLNPVFLGSAPTFMSDIPSAFLLVAALYAFARALDSGDGTGAHRLRLAWLVAATGFALLAGANRQLFWAVGFAAFASSWLVLAPSERNRRLLPALCGIVAAAVLLSLWFARQPYAIPLSFDSALQLWGRDRALLFWFVYKFWAFAGFYLLPATLPAVVVLWRRHPKPAPLLLVCFAAAVIPLLYFLVAPSSAFEIWNGRWGLTVYGQYTTYQGIQVGGVNGYAARPAVLAPSVGVLLFAVSAAGLALLLWVLLANRCRSPLGIACLVAALAQLILPLPWYAGGSVFDRYYTALLPCLLVAIADGVWTGEEGARRPSALLYGLPLAALYAVWGYLCSAEYFAATRARATLYQALLARGVPPEQIDAGVETCGDTQIAKEGYINNTGIHNPAGAFRERLGDCIFEPYLFPAMNARYMIFSFYPAPDLSHVKSRDALTLEPRFILDADYSSPLPPRKRFLYVYRVSPIPPRPTPQPPAP